MTNKKRSRLKRMNPDKRRGIILAHAVRLAEEIGFPQITRDKAAAKAGCSSALIGQYFNSMAEFKKEVMRAAVKLDSLEVVMQGMVMHDPVILEAIKLDPALEQRALKLLADQAISTLGKQSQRQ